MDVIFNADAFSRVRIEFPKKYGNHTKVLVESYRHFFIIAYENLAQMQGPDWLVSNPEP